MFTRKRVSLLSGFLASTALIVSLATPGVMKNEGAETNAYLDPIGKPTICFGETAGVHMGDTKSLAECKTMLASRLAGFLSEMQACTKSPVPLPAKTQAAFLAFTYNVGSPTYCSNIAAKRINLGRVWEACMALSLYTKAKGRELPGLVRRRAEERAMCEAGLTEAGISN